MKGGKRRLGGDEENQPKTSSPEILGKVNEGGAISGRGGHEGYVGTVGKEKDKLSVLDKT